jgi:hypothetical protein
LMRWGFKTVILAPYRGVPAGYRAEPNRDSFDEAHRHF